MQAFWNERYAQNETVYGQIPNTYFKLKIDALQPSKILLPAEGEGRNAVYAASIGWQVDAFDYSGNAQKKAMQLANKMGVQINYETLEINAFNSLQQYEAIGLIYVHLSEKERFAFHRKMVDALLPGGVLILEAFSKAQIKNTSGGPKSLEELYAVEELKADFANLNILEIKEEVCTLDEGPFHKGHANVIRLFAKK